MKQLGQLEHMILLVLDRVGGAYGMGILQDITDKTTHTPSAGAIYTTLERLEDKGYVSSKWWSGRTIKTMKGRGRRSQRLFWIKPLGLKALKESRKTLDDLR